MLTRFFAALLIVSAVSCGSIDGPATGTTYRGEPLAVVKGRMTAERTISLVGDVRLAVGWFTSAKPGAARPDSVYSESVIYEPVFPTGFEFGLYDLPATSQGLVEGPSGVPAAAVGILFAYDDRNQNGALDTYRAGEQPVDLVLGTSLGSGSTQEGYVIVFVEELGQPGMPPSLKRGLNLVRVDGEVVDFDTQVPVHLDGALLWNLFMCEGIFEADGGSACFDALQPRPDSGVTPGTDGGRQLSVSGSVGLVSGSRFANLSVQVNGVNRPDASVSINGVPLTYNATSNQFTLNNGPVGSVLAAANNVIHAESSDAPPLDVNVFMPGNFSVTAPSFNATLPTNTPFSVAWSDSQDAGSYRVTVYRSSPFASIFNQRDIPSPPFTVPAISYQGNATLNVEASVANVTAPGGTLIVPYVNQSLPIVFQ